MPTRWICGAFCLVALMALAAPAQAQELRYTYAEGGWIRDNPEGADTENGWFLGGQFGTRRFHFFAEYADPGPLDYKQAGGGWHGLFGDRIDLIAEAAYVDLDFDEGYRVTGGVRWYLLDKLEVDGFVTRTDLGSFENSSFGIGGVWDLKERLSVGAKFDLGDESDTLRAFVRFYLGKTR